MAYQPITTQEELIAQDREFNDAMQEAYDRGEIEVDTQEPDYHQGDYFQGCDDLDDAPPTLWTIYTITPYRNVTACRWTFELTSVTNDETDNGTPGEEVHNLLHPASMATALDVAGVSRIGCSGIEVNVYVRHLGEMVKVTDENRDYFIKQYDADEYSRQAFVLEDGLRAFWNTVRQGLGIDDDSAIIDESLWTEAHKAISRHIR